jgi:hypothetical protein
MASLQRELVRQFPVTLRGLRKQKIGARKQGAAHNRSYLASRHKGQGGHYRHAAMVNPEWPACCVGIRSPGHGFYRANWHGLSRAQRRCGALRSRPDEIRVYCLQPVAAFPALVEAARSL